MCNFTLNVPQTMPSHYGKKGYARSSRSMACLEKLDRSADVDDSSLEHPQDLHEGVQGQRQQRARV